KRAAAASTLVNQRAFAVTESLGSYFFLDAQLRRMQGVRPDDNDLYAFLMFDLGTVYMFANQVSLLHLGALRAVCEIDAPESAPCPNRRLDRLELPPDAPAANAQATSEGSRSAPAGMAMMTNY